MRSLAAAIALLLASGCGSDFSPPQIQMFAASSPSIALGESTDLVFSVDFTGSLSIDQGIGDVTGRTSVTVTPTATTTYTLTARTRGLAGILRSTSTVTVVVGHGTPTRIAVDGVPAEVAVDSPVAVTMTVRDRLGNLVTDYSGTVRIASTDAAAPPIPDVVFTPAMGGTATIPVTFYTDGNHSLVASDVANGAVSGAAVTHVNHGAATAYVLSPLPASAVAGTSLVLTIKAVDRHGNLVTNYAGTAHLSSADPTDQLPADGGFNGGVRNVSLAFVTAGTHGATVAEAGGTIGANTTAVAVSHAAPARVTLQGLPASVTVDASSSVAATVRDAFGNPALSYTGTLRFTLTDPAAPAIPDVPFTPAMQGVATIPLVFFTAGDFSVTATDTKSSSVTGTAATRVNHGPASAYSLSALPASAVAGVSMPLTIRAVDAHGNLVTDYAGAAHVSSGDATDQLPSDGSFTGGVRTVSLAFVTAGSHGATVTEAGGTIAANTTTVAVTHAAPARVTLQGLPAAVTVDASNLVTATVRDTFGNPALSYTGTLRFTLGDTSAPAIPDVPFTPAMQGVATVPVVFFKAGDFSVTATDTTTPSVTGSARTTVNHGPAAAYSLAALPASAVAGVPMPLTISVVDAHGNLVTDYAGAAHVSSGDATDQLPPDGGFTGGVRTVSLAFVTAGMHAAIVSEAGGTISATTTFVNVAHAAASALRLTGVPAQVTVDVPTTVTATLRDAFGNVVTNYAGTLHFVLTDLAAPPIADVTFTPAMLGTADVSIVFFSDGDQSILVNDTAAAALATSAPTHVNHGPAAAYSLSPLPAGSLAGEPLPLTIKAVDVHGNVVTSYAKTAHLSSTDGTDLLPADGGFTAGVRTVSLAFVTAAIHSATVSEVGGTIAATTSSVNVVSADAADLVATGAAATAGAASSTSLTVKDRYGNTVGSYTGTVSFTSTDSGAVLPVDYTFVTADAGQHTFPVTLKAAGAQTVTATDPAHSLSAVASFTVSPADATQCLLTGLPSSAAAGAELGFRVTMLDAFANTATGYTGTVALSSSDNAAQLAGGAAFTATDGGSRVFAVELRSSGLQTVTATDAASSIVCQGAVNVIPGAALFAVTFPSPDAWAGTAVTATVRAQDGFGNLITNFAGTIAFATSDTAATPKPLASVTLNGSEGGVTNVTITFNTIGTQSLTATQVGASATTGTGLQTVHGLVYTAPPSGGKVRLVANAATTASFVQLDLVSNATLQVTRSAAVDAQLACNSTQCSRRGGAFGAGMNLPLDVTKVSADPVLISTTAPVGSVAVFTLGPAPQAVAALINTVNGVLYSGVSQKRAETSGASTTLRGDAPVSPFPGAAGSGGFYYSLRLRLIPGAAVGTVFDGANLGAKFRAAVRDRSGSDVFSNPDFAIGKLEVK